MSAPLPPTASSVGPTDGLTDGLAAGPPAALSDGITRFLQHLRVERRLAARTLAMYADALGWLQQMAAHERDRKSVV